MCLIDILSVLLLLFIISIIIKRLLHKSHNSKIKYHQTENFRNQKFHKKAPPPKKCITTNIQYPKPCQKTKDFRDEFFRFRDFIEINSSIQEDPVDRVNNMQLNGTLEHNSDVTIANIFDDLLCIKDRKFTQTNNCIREPKFDDIIDNDYKYEYGSPGVTLTRDDWNYPDESINNGGRINGNLFAHDPKYEQNLGYEQLFDKKYDY